MQENKFESGLPPKGVSLMNYIKYLIMRKFHLSAVVDALLSETKGNKSCQINPKRKLKWEKVKKISSKPFKLRYVTVHYFTNISMRNHITFIECVSVC